ncbi:hypothetical protein [Lactococcus lactis]|uniref:hypothetical protein n=1 Tax=Lactococcus lactis TaxID=1358 RepID=UPI002FE43895
MIDSEYEKFVSEMSGMFKPQKETTRVIIGESPYPDGKNLTKFPGYPYNEVAFLRSAVAVGPTNRTVKIIWNLLFNNNGDKVRGFLKEIKDPGATSTREEYLAKYLADEQGMYLVNAFADIKCHNISKDLKILSRSSRNVTYLVVGKNAASAIRFFSQNKILYIIHPSARGKSYSLVNEQWRDFNHKGNGIYDASTNVIKEFRL